MSSDLTMHSICGNRYAVDKHGSLVQANAAEFKYDNAYISIYDTDRYTQDSDTLQALRVGFITAAHRRPVTSLFDYGYGNGAFMNFARQVVTQVRGFDPVQRIVEGCERSSEIPPVDVLTLWDVLEHLEDVSFLENCLVETVAVTVPFCHWRSEGIAWVADHYPHLKPNEHVRHFDEASLTSLMASLDWHPVAVAHHEDLVRASVHGLPNTLSMAFKRHC